MKKVNEKKIVTRTQRAATRWFFLAVTLLLLGQATISLFFFNVKVVKTQWELGNIAEEIRAYESFTVKTNEMTDQANKLFERREELVNSPDKVISMVAKPGFSFFIFPGVLLLSIFIVFIVGTFVALNWRFLVKLEILVIVFLLSVAFKPLKVISYQIFQIFLHAEKFFKSSYRQRKSAVQRQIRCIRQARKEAE